MSKSPVNVEESNVTDQIDCCVAESESPSAIETSVHITNTVESAPEVTTGTASNHCDIPTADDQFKNESVEAELSEMAGQAASKGHTDSTSTSAHESKVSSPISTPESDDHSEVR